MPDHEIGIGLAGSLLPQTYRDIARRAEDAGFDAITVFGDLMFSPPALVLHTMAEVTRSIRLGVAAYTPWTQHPVEIAGQIAYLDLMSSGRAFYGVVRGAWMDKLALDQSDALAAVEDTVAIVSALLAGNGSGHVGKVYSMSPNTRLHFEPHRPRVPLLIGSWSPRLARIAGRLADELQAGGCANPAMVKVLADMAGTTGGRPGICLNAIAVVDEDRKAARAAARTAVAPYFDVVARFDPTVTVDPELQERVHRYCAAGDFTQAGRLIPDDLLGLFAFSGTPADVAEHAASILDAGAQRVEFDTPFGLTPESGIALLCDEVIGRIRAHL
ncbi:MULTISPECIES: LLM class flavin-dependent oxidoreductase [unclassified Mycolicibacterium]|uniref:LLM class flavin-dependent oxidoreductase n=1 Tax=unclassified Mycolicibacterium TaxID=2636767 RepID=UPI00192E70BB|nr:MULTISPECIES: LLM class flavin-dependent oxidoreductase [unclassified Mycolicibacterium]